MKRHAIRDPRAASPPPPLLLWGFAPVVLGLVLAILMVLLAPSVAPERVVIEPVEQPAAGPEVPRP